MSLEKAGEELLTLAKDGVIKGVELAQQQLPDLCQQIIKWAIWEGVAAGITLGLLLIAGAIIARKLYKDNEEMSIVEWLIYIAIIAIIITIFSPYIFNGIQAYVAPKLYLIEYVSDLIKSK